MVETFPENETDEAFSTADHSMFLVPFRTLSVWIFFSAKFPKVLRGNFDSKENSREIILLKFLEGVTESLPQMCLQIYVYMKEESTPLELFITSVTVSVIGIAKAVYNFCTKSDDILEKLSDKGDWQIFKVLSLVEKNFWLQNWSFFFC